MTSATPIGEEVNGTTTSRVLEHIRTAILAGKFAPGDRIRQEDVAATLGTSRIPVREALRILAAEGLAEHETNKGARVPHLLQAEVDVIYRMRERLEPLALDQSMPYLGESHLARLEEVQQEIEANQDVDEFVALDREFHLLSYSGCQIDQVNTIVTRLWNSTQHYRRAFVALSGAGRRWVINAEHRLLLDAIERRDAVDAERYLSGHIRRTRIELDKHPEIFRPSTGGARGSRAGQ
jgi:DNA-binding GntR family transcriptional regulator